MSGVGPRQMKPGDFIAVIYRLALPFIIRGSENKIGYQLRGEYCVHDILHGESVQS